MRSDLPTGCAARLAHRLDRAVRRARIDLLLRLAGFGCGVAAATAAGAAGLDWWIRPGRLWLGGSVVWAVAVASVVWLARRLASYLSGPGKVAGWWPTRLTTARRWERELPAGGSSISAAVGFLTGFGGDARGSVENNLLTATGQPAVTAASAADFAALAIQRADLAASELPRDRCPTSGLTLVLLGLAAGAGLLLSARLGPADWQTAVMRQLPPAVGGWPPVRTLPKTARQVLPALTPAEIPAATRRLIARMEACARAAQTTDFDTKLVRVADEAGELAERLPAAAAAGIIRWAAERLPAVVVPLPRADQVTAVRWMAEAGNAAAELAVVAAGQQQLAEQLARLLVRQPGLLPEELPLRAQQQLGTLAATQRRLAETAAAAAVVLLDRGLAAPVPVRPASLRELIGRNRLAVATAAASRTARGLAEAVTPLGLDIPKSGDVAGATLSDSLTLAVVGLTAVARELDRERQERAEAQAAAAGKLAAAPLTAAAGDRNRQPATGEPAPGGLPGIAGRSAGGSAATTSPPVASPAAAVVAGPAWKLATPERPAVGRVAIDRTLPPATAEAFNDYLERLGPPPVAPEVFSEQVKP